MTDLKGIAELYEPEVLEKLAVNIERVAAAAEQLMSGPLTEDTIVMLIKHKCFNSRSMSTETIKEVIRAAQSLRSYLKKPEKGKK